jgi:hypothetical protein
MKTGCSHSPMTTVGQTRPRSAGGYFFLLFFLWCGKTAVAIRLCYDDKDAIV